MKSIVFIYEFVGPAVKPRNYFKRFISRPAALIQIQYKGDKKQCHLRTKILLVLTTYRADISMNVQTREMSLSGQEYLLNKDVRYTTIIDILDGVL